ncbi:MAG: 2-hydroxyacyl-CoA dehydratase family protein, partial [Actinobacteria bacterium]|nr:2-hydroxyacyl-CoA dehydratase family protein [Actinomycetota bacterium]
LRDARRASPPPISGRDALLVNQIAFYDNPARFTESVNKLCDELETRTEGKVSPGDNGAPRVVISGCPMALPNWKLPFIVESSGADVVAEESCVGERGFRTLVDEDGETLDEMIDNLVDRYLTIDCACFTPNPERVEHVLETSREFDADGVIHYSISFCTPYMVEAKKVEDALSAAGIPLLKIETDYSQGDVGQLQTRIDAFLEMLKARHS